MRQIEAAGAAVHYDGPAYSEGMAAIGSQLPLWYHVFNKVKSVVLSTDIHPSNATQPDTKQALTEIIPALRRLTELGRVYVRTPVALSLSGLTAEEARIQYATRRLKAALPHCDVIVE